MGDRPYVVNVPSSHLFSGQCNIFHHNIVKSWQIVVVDGQWNLGNVFLTCLLANLITVQIGRQYSIMEGKHSMILGTYVNIINNGRSGIRPSPYPELAIDDKNGKSLTLVAFKVQHLRHIGTHTLSRKPQLDGALPLAFQICWLLSAFWRDRV